MDLANTLIRSVVRAFYETRHILVIDALFIHSVLHVEDLALLLGMQQKDLRKLCARLREDRLIAVHSRPEIRAGVSRPTNREYYYIPLHPVVDGIKFRVSRLTSTIKAQYTPSAERKEYVCQRCGSEWTQLEVLNRVGPEGFECHRCGAPLSRAEDLEGGAGPDRSGHEKNSKLMAQLDKILKLLKQIDSVDVPANDFDSAWDHKVEVERNQMTNPTRAAVAAPARQAAVRGTARTDENALEISLTSSAEKSAAEQEEVAARKAALEKQNALPVWHTESTVSTEAGNLRNVKPETNGVDTTGVDIKSDLKDEKKPEADALDDKVAAYYAEMAREKEREAKEDASSGEEESSDEEEDEFEDVGVTTTNAATPVAGSTPIPASGNGSLKRELDSESGSSAPNTNAATPNTPLEDGPVAKKVKLEPEVKKEEESDEDEEEEFEDV
ncbi:hypothetical protein FQN54_000810 [Arachnomyces sp. PD_36]|nr:hypothetical protein FQN54_000810 [Arachnomyces sp. PD_36]